MTGRRAGWYRYGVLVAVVCAVLTWPALITAQGENGSGRGIASADRIDVRLTLQPDGTLLVRERLAIEIGDRRVSRFERIIREAHQEGITLVAARVDGVASPIGEGAGAVSVRGQSPFRVRWTVDLAARSQHTFELEYVAAGVIGVDGGHGRLRWPALQPDRGYPVEEAEITFTADPSTTFYAGSGMAESGWAVERRADGFAATRANVPPKAGATFMAEFAIDAATMPRPRWQDDERRALDLMPAFLSGGLFILVVAAGILWIVRFQYPSERVLPRDSRPADTPIAPALAVALADRGRELRRPTLGTTIDLAMRRFVAFEPGEGSHIRVAVTDGPADLLAHERVVLEALRALDGVEIARGRLTSEMQRVARPFQRALRADLVDAGFVDTERAVAARNLRIGGVVSLALGLVFAGVVALLLSRFGPWPYAMPAAFVVGGLALVIAGASFSRLNAQGERGAAEWRLRTKALRHQHADATEAESIDTAITWLPLAAADGYGSAWIKRFADRLRGEGAALRWWTPRAGDERTESLGKFMQEIEQSMGQKTH